MSSNSLQLDSLSADDLVSGDTAVTRNHNTQTKRQLRNKESAKRCRIKRKAYIKTLEKTAKDQEEEIVSLKSQIQTLSNELQLERNRFGNEYLMREKEIITCMRVMNEIFTPVEELVEEFIVKGIE